jgi:hypothetical protein
MGEYIQLVEKALEEAFRFRSSSGAFGGGAGLPPGHRGPDAPRSRGQQSFMSRERNFGLNDEPEPKVDHQAKAREYYSKAKKALDAGDHTAAAEHKSTANFHYAKHKASEGK